MQILRERAQDCRSIFFLLCLLKGTQDDANSQRLHYRTEYILSHGAAVSAIMMEL
jgi:hypothetical protein